MLLFTDRFSRRSNVFAATATEFSRPKALATSLSTETPPRPALCMPTQHNSWTMGLQFCSKLSHAAYQLLGGQKMATSSYHPNGNGDVERVNQTMAQTLAMVTTSYLRTTVRSAQPPD